MTSFDDSNAPGAVLLKVLIAVGFLALMLAVAIVPAALLVLLVGWVLGRELTAIESWGVLIGWMACLKFGTRCLRRAHITLRRAWR